MGRWSDRNKQNTIKDEMYQKLSNMFKEGKGRSRHEDKKASIDRNYIYSEKTYRTYTNEAKHFRVWIREHHAECRHLKDCKKHVNEYLQGLIDSEKSAYTISTRKAALAKLFQVDYGFFIETPGRYRKNITRSRLNVAYDRHISTEKEAYWGRITSATGLRLSELLRIRGSDLKKIGDTYILHITKGTKGGKDRYAPVLDDEVAKLIELSGDRPAFPNIPKAFDNHHHRGEYAKKLYNMYARPLEEIPKKDRYIMRKDLRGVVLDKKAMKIVSEAMGHTHISVIAQSYLY